MVYIQSMLLHNIIQESQAATAWIQLHSEHLIAAVSPFLYVHGIMRVSSNCSLLKVHIWQWPKEPLLAARVKHVKIRQVPFMS